MPRVSKVVHPLVAAEARLRLSQLIVVMGKFEILPSRVNVDPFSQNVPSNNGALNVPSRPPGSKGGFPRRLAGLARLPKCKIVGIALLAPPASAQGALALRHLCGGGCSSTGPGRIQLTIIVTRRLESVQAEVYGSVALVRHTLCNDLLHESHDFGHVFRNPRQDVRLADAQRLHILHELAFVLSRVCIEHRVVGNQMSLFSIQLLGEDRLGRR
mmetsp:Transcript_10602/g.18616  ORF Transcript_10602/g.18616 Transcript_10602/m.18616 type:complete len:214 (-) Transcript_10602:743-1384(-)